MATDDTSLTATVGQLRQFLAANISVSLGDGDTTKAATFQQFLDAVDTVARNQPAPTAHGPQ